jgi:hypothetical protein
MFGAQVEGWAEQLAHKGDMRKPEGKRQNGDQSVDGKIILN